MRVITQQTLGGPEVLTIVDAPEPQPLPTEVLVRVKAIGLNPLEARLRAGEFPLIGRPPFILGWDISGVVEQAPQTWRFRPGDEVFGMPLFPRAASAYAEVVSAPALHLARKPASLSHVEASALPIVGLTAWQGLVDLGGVTEGDRVLVHGGGGGVGHVAIQIAKALGAHVIATAGGSKRKFVEGFGADEVIDYTAVDFTETVRDIDVVFDTVGGDTALRSLPTLRDGGRLVGISSGTDAADEAAAGSVHVVYMLVEPDRLGLEALAELVERGALRVHVERTFPLHEAARAHELSESGRTKGKLVLTVV
jgi:NADPH:quinone reductase-like Zn-dependent oxidoreductase